MFQIKLSESTATRRRIPVLLVDSTDGFTPKTGQTAPTVTISKNGATAVSGAGTFTEVGNGVYYYEFTAGEADTLGWIALNVQKAVCRQYNAIIQVMAYDYAAGTNLGLTNLDAAITTRMATFTYTAPPTAATIATQIWTEPIPGSFAVGTAGAKLNSASSAGDPWSTAVPGIYAAGTAGFILGTNLNGTITSRLASASYTAPPSVTDIWNTNVSGYTTAGYAGTYQKNLDQLISTRLASSSYTAPPTAQNVWEYGNRTLTSGAAPSATTIADAVLNRKLDSTGDGTDTLNERTVRSALRAMRNKVVVASGVMTVSKEDDTATAWTGSLSNTSDVTVDPV